MRPATIGEELRDCPRSTSLPAGTLNPRMTPAGPRPSAPTPPAPVDRRAVVAGAIVLVGFALVAVSLVGLVLLGRDDAAGFEVATRPAPPLELTDQDGRPFTLTSFAGRPVLVFFGYTHCPDVCPESIGLIGQALAASPAGVRAVFVSIDPERDDVAAMKAYTRYLPRRSRASPARPTRCAAPPTRGPCGTRRRRRSPDPARTACPTPPTSSWSTARAGSGPRSRTGRRSGPIEAWLMRLLTDAARAVRCRRAGRADLGGDRSPQASAAAVTSSAPMPMGDLRATVVSTSVWAGGQSPVILSLADAMGMPLDGSAPVSVRVVGADGAPVGPDVAAVAVRPAGEQQVSYVATVDIPSPGSWRLDVTAGGSTGQVIASTPSTRAARRPSAARRPTSTRRRSTTSAATCSRSRPSRSRTSRLYQSSTADARAAGRPYVIVIDSARFKVSPACGRAISMVRYLIDRWPGVTFIHLEPFPYQIVTGEPVLDGDIASPPVNAATRAFGLGDATWPSTKMPWVFVVDGNGHRARQGDGRHRQRRHRPRAEPGHRRGRAGAADPARRRGRSARPGGQARAARRRGARGRPACRGSPRYRAAPRRAWR